MCLKKERLKYKKKDIKYKSVKLATHGKKRKKKCVSKRNKNGVMPIKCNGNKDACFFYNKN